VRPALVLLFLAHPALAAQPPLLRPEHAQALAAELSGETAKSHLEFIARHHRMRGSRGFHAAAEHLRDALRAYGYADAQIESFPADGRTFYGTQRSRRPWDAEFAELWELARRGDAWVRSVRLASWESLPVSLAQDSESGSVTAELVDVGAGTADSDYAGKDVRGKLILASAQPGPVARLGVVKHGAAGIVSYAQNQRTAWWGEDGSLVRWGHLDTFAASPTFAFMVSLQQARAFQQRLARGEAVRLEATVRAGQHDGAYEIVTATLPGGDPARREEEIVFSCHLDHQRPGANDNASGCVTILEVARTLGRLVADGRLPRPARTLRFVWPPEIEGTITLLNARPERSARTKAAIHLDMVGGGPETKAVFHVTRGPASLPSFAYDVAEALASFVNDETDAFAGGRSADYPLVAPEGGREPLQARLSELSLGSDHQVYSEGSFAIPSLYFNDWPDRYIHTNRDVPANIDPTKLKRAAFLAAANGLVLANASAEDAGALWSVVASRAMHRGAVTLERRAGLPADEAAGLTRQALAYERALLASFGRFFTIPAATAREAEGFLSRLAAMLGAPGAAPVPSGDGALVFHRNPAVKGPMGAFGYDYFTDKYGEDKARGLALLRFAGLRGDGGDYAYEVLNLVDGKRTAAEIREAVSATYGPVPLTAVVEYLKALESIEVVGRARDAFSRPRDPSEGRRHGTHGSPG
jgi:aminopeptidase YwaD